MYCGIVYCSCDKLIGVMALSNSTAAPLFYCGGAAVEEERAITLLLRCYRGTYCGGRSSLLQLPDQLEYCRNLSSFIRSVKTLHLQRRKYKNVRPRSLVWSDEALNSKKQSHSDFFQIVFLCSTFCSLLLLVKYTNNPKMIM